MGPPTALRRRSLLLLAACTVAAVTTAEAPSEALAFDVVVYGSSPAGIAAAITAAGNGTRRVALVEPLPLIGGMGSAGGLGLADQIDKDLSAVTGLALAWARLNGAHYGNASEAVLVPDMWVAQASWEAMIASAGSITVFTSCPMDNVVRVGTLIANITTDCAGTGSSGSSGGLTTFTAPVFIDSSYDGEVVVAAGLSFAYGREGVAQYNESIAGVQTSLDPGESFAGLEVPVTYDNGTFIPYVSTDPLPPTGSGDDKLMAFQHRVCLTSDSDNSVPFPRPEGYNPEDFILLQRALEAEVSRGQYPHGPPFSWFASLGSFSPAVGRAGRHKYIVCCGGGPVNSDGVDLNRGWATANRRQRQAMVAAHTYYLQGSLHYLANDPRVPNATQAEARKYGLCADEWVDYGNWPVQLYVRESVRLVGDTVLTQNTLATPRYKEDSVAVGAWFFDSHIVSRYGVRNASGTLVAVNDGYWRALVPSGKDCNTGNCTAPYLWYDLPLSVMLPKAAECGNLLVPVALSVSNVAWASSRIETMFMGLGAAAGNAAALVVQAGGPGVLPVQRVDVSAVQAQLAAQGWMLHGNSTWGQRVSE